MPQVRLNLDLSAKLMLHVRLLELVLEEHLQRDNVLASLLAREVDVPKLAPTERFADVEVAQLRARVGRVGECGQDDGVAGRGGERAAHSR